jgi:hypothetical protein
MYEEEQRMESGLKAPEEEYLEIRQLYDLDKRDCNRTAEKET